MSTLWEHRAARNEALFREVNENIAELEEAYGAQFLPPEFICECADDLCTEHMPVDVETYHRVRDNPRWFIVLPGHVDKSVETVVETYSGYVIVEKTGFAGEIAEQASDN